MSDDLRELAAERAALDLIGERLAEAKKTNAKRMQAALDAADKASGQERVSAALPSGEEIATISLRKGTWGPVVTDPEAFALWVRDTIGGEFVDTRIVREVRPWKAAELVAAMATLELSVAPVGQPLRAAQWADPTTGEIVDVPGVHIKPTSARTHARTWKAGGKARLVAAYLSGELDGVVRAALAPAAEDAPGAADGEAA